MLKDLIRLALDEDSVAKDITSQAIFTKSNKISQGYLEAKQDLVLSGLDVARDVFAAVSKKIKFISGHANGAFLKKGERFAKIVGPVTDILCAERVALNFLQQLSGVATLTRKYVDAVKPYKAKILDTRKTIPGLRELQKRAVVHGGGFNHRMNLSDQFLIKDNHIAACGGVKEALKKVLGKSTIVEVEVQNIKELKEALSERPDIILLDNMKLSDIKKAVKLVGAGLRPALGRTRTPPLLEISGGVDLKNVRQYAKTGVDRISIGRLTHSAPAVDISLELLC